MLSFHTSPLAQPGVGDSGGMNVYVRELVAGLAHAGVEVTTYTREWKRGLPREVLVEPNHRVVHVPAGALDLPKEELESVIPRFTDFVIEDMKRGDTRDGRPTDVVHANYWLSGIAGHSIKHELGIPLVTTFHTLARVKAEGGDPESERRERAEADIIGCADAICVSCDQEEEQFVRLYGNPPGDLEIVAPGVEHAFFTPGDRRGARHALGMGDGPVLLFVGRIQPLKGVDVAVRALAALGRDDARLYVVGGASGAEGDTEVHRVRALVTELGLDGRVHFVAPQAHHILSTYYRAADAVWVPSRSESFGLVALEAAACGIPVVANAVGGLLSLVDHGSTGFLVNDRDPEQFAAYTDHLLRNPSLAASMRAAAAERGRRYTWSFAAARLRRVYTDITTRSLVNCS